MSVFFIDKIDNNDRQIKLNGLALIAIENEIVDSLKL